MEPQVIRAGKYKSAAETFVRSDLSEPNREQLQALLTTTNSQFANAIAADRSLSAEALKSMAQEEPLLKASAAVEEGLIDGIRYGNEVRTALRHAAGQAGETELSTVSLSKYKRVSASSAGVSYTGTGTVDIVYAQGSIVPGDPSENPFAPDQQALGSTSLIDALESARTSASTEAVVLRINSPGGSASASEAMWRAVERTANEKPVIVSMGDVAASGGYYIAAAADTIVANPTTTTGSIGVFGPFFNVEGFFNDKLGVTFDAVQTSPYADVYSPIGPFTQSERRLLAASVDRTYDTFLQRVAEGRRMDTSAVHDVAQGRVWSGRDAVSAGLVDTLGTLDDAIQIAGRSAGLGEGPYRTRILPRPKTFVERLNEQLYGQAAHVWQSLFSSPLEEKVQKQRRLLERVMGESGSVQARLPIEIEIQ